VSKLPAEFLDSLDHAEFRRICRSSRASNHKIELASSKRHLGRAWKRAVRLNLDRSDPLDVLEIGPGAGYFLYVCQRLAHRVVGIDRPSLRLWPQVHQWLGVTVIDHMIEPNRPLADLGRRFDLVVAYNCPFNYVRGERRLWNRAEWTFLLDHLRDDVLKRGGRFVIDMRAKSVGGRVATPDDAVMLQQVCRSRGGSGERLIVFDPLH
jgi:SAM-dependent methyltransferase